MTDDETDNRMTILKVHLIPKVHHALVLGDTTGGLLLSIDKKMVRKVVAEWLKLPKHSRTEASHANVSDGGGLAVMQLSKLIPHYDWAVA